MNQFLKKHILLLGIAMFIFIPTSLWALNLGSDLAEDAATGAGYEVAGETTLAENIGFIIQIALSFVGTIFLILIVYAGILWMTARGEEDQVEDAQEMIQQAVIGLIITLSAYSITVFVVPRIVAQTGGSAGAGGGNGSPDLACEQRYRECKKKCEDTPDDVNGQPRVRGNVSEGYRRCVTRACEPMLAACR